MENRGHSKSAWVIFGIAVVVVAVLIFFFAWLPRERREQRIEQEAKQETEEAPRVNVAHVHRAQNASELMIPGTSQAYTEAYIFARASGYVSRRLVDIGDRVHKGQLLATIDSPELDQQVAQARSALLQSQATVAQLEAQLHLQQVNWDRYKVLVAKGVFSKQQGDQQEADFRVAQANVEAAKSSVQGNRENLQRNLVLQSYERVTAPFDGLITARNVDVGTLISATGSGQGLTAGTGPSAAPLTGGAQGGEMFGIADISRLRVLVSAPEAYSAAIRVGERGELFFQELQNEKFEGRVTRTSSSIDQNTRTLLVELQVSNPKGKLLPGMYVQVNFLDVQAERPLMIPGEAIIVRNAKQTVGVVQDNTVHFRPVSIGRDYGDESEILRGLNEGDVIVTTVTDDVREGGKIQPQYPKRGAEQAAERQSGSSAGQGGQYGNQAQTQDAKKTNGQKPGQKSGSTAK